mmetsp:Transcript_50826/g.121054  ORF Transcript_50826/g.121054 Transcript_50826/m.121054 type:complete len:80 (-) Transcript_50826:359-598(-)
MMLCARRTVESRCAITSTVRPCIDVSIADCTEASEAVSSALVASSSSKTAGSRTSARAIAIRCFCPPERWLPFSPAMVS